MMSIHVALGAFAIGLGCAVAVNAQQTRDAVSATPAATGSIVGSVLSATATPSTPLPGAIVTVSGDGLPVPVSAVTDDRGAFVLPRLPVGPYTLTATKPGYLPETFGASALGRQGTPISLSSSAVVTATITLTKGAALTGVVRDEHGMPIADVPIVVVEAARALLSPTRSIRDTRSGRSHQFTDDRGVYRVYGLAPGEYFIAAIPPAQRTWAGSLLVRREAEIDATLAQLQRRLPGAATDAPAPASTGSTILAPVFYPATANVLEAARIKVGTAEERAGLDILVRPQTTRTLTGAVIAPGVAASDVLIQIRSGSQIPLLAGITPAPRVASPPNRDGQFAISHLVPGRYTISARTGPGVSVGNYGPDGKAVPDPLFAQQTVDIANADVHSVELHLRPGGRIAGRLVVDSLSAASAAQMSPIFLVVGPATPRTGAASRVIDATETNGAASVRPDSMFEFRGLGPGHYRLDLQSRSLAAGGWWLRSAMAGGRDLLDGPIEIGLGTAITNVTLTLTDRHNELGGTLRDAAGAPGFQYVVVVFPEDRSLWTAGARRLRSARPSTDGYFSFVDLPAGRYLLAALTDLDPDDWHRAEFLSEIVPAAVSVTLADGVKTRQDLRIK